MSASDVPASTYRLQFNQDFTFADAAALVDYLDRLGISHIFASPYLRARSGSPHGYDIVDHNALNPEIGTQADYDALVAALHERGMGQILDIVPNHMGVGGSDNSWWLDVLEHGQASDYARYFDIDWHPIKPEMDNKVLLPFLGDHYGTLLEAGQLQLHFDAEAGWLALYYYEHCFPIDPQTYPRVLGRNLETLQGALAGTGGVFDDFRMLLEDFQALPPRTHTAPAQRRQRRRGADDGKHRLSALCQSWPAVAAFIQDNVNALNGTPGDPASFDALHSLIESQAWRPAYWLVAADEINYRRFFDINDLAGLRVEDPEVFASTHGLIRQLVEQRQVDGLRIDHIDGLSDPGAYCRELRRMVAAHTDAEHFPLLPEKILASHERLPEDWSVEGTTGYETAYLINGLLVRGDTERELNRQYIRFIHSGESFDAVLQDRKRLIIQSSLSSELTVLANLLSRIAQTDRHTRDFTYHSLRAALSEVVAAFPVYRTYITAEGASDADRRYIDWAVAQAKKRSPAADIQVFDFIRNILLLDELEHRSPPVRQRILQFTLRFQQYTAPVMAKGMEDTAFYVYNRLVSLNDVGFDPRSYGISLAAFHHEMAARSTHWPHAMTTTSTHDSKRGEDVRARIDVLSELPDLWRQHLRRWTRLNRSRKQQVEDMRAPSRNDEYLLYQTLLGAWPLEALDEAGIEAFRERIEAYMFKAVREAKVHSSWINPNEAYEQAVSEFIGALLRRPERNAFLSSFLPFKERIARLGLFNSLSQTLLKLTLPGFPDTYQGNELWAFNLVDPDNRRPVDFRHRQALLSELAGKATQDSRRVDLVHELLDNLEDGRAKLYVTWVALTLRRREPELFAAGDYQPLETQGRYSEHVCAFARRHADKTVIVAVARWFAGLVDEDHPLPIGPEIWNHTRLILPDDLAGSYHDLLTGTAVNPVADAEDTGFDGGDLFAHFPLAVLINDRVSGRDEG